MVSMSENLSEEFNGKSFFKLISKQSKKKCYKCFYNYICDAGTDLVSFALIILHFTYIFL